MARTSDVSEALAALQARWGSAAPRRGSELTGMVEGALARAPMPLDHPVDATPGAAPADPVTPAPLPFAVPTGAPRPGVPATDTEGRVVSTGFTALDAILGTGGLPRSATVALRGSASSGKTTVALRVAAEAQAGGAIVAWLDLARSFDPVEAVSRGVRPEWLVVLAPADLEEALALAGSLLASRTVDLLVLDLPDGRDPAVAGKRVGDRLGRLSALARRAGTLLLVLEPDALGRTLAAAVEAASGLRLEMRREGWIRLGRDVVGQRSTAAVERNRYGPPGRRAELEILYAEGGTRDACLRRPELLTGVAGPVAPPGVGLVVPAAVTASARALAAPGAAPPSPLSADRKGPHAPADPYAPALPALAAPAPALGPRTPRDGGPPSDADAVQPGRLRLLADGADRSRWPAVDGRDRGGRGPAGAGAGRPAGDPAGNRASAGPGGRLPGSRA